MTHELTHSESNEKQFDCNGIARLIFRKGPLLKNAVLIAVPNDWQSFAHLP